MKSLNLPSISSDCTDPSGTKSAGWGRQRGAAEHIVHVLLEERPGPQRSLNEASVHRSRRSRVYVAAYQGISGQEWRSTGSRDLKTALSIARKFERQARAQRALLGADSQKMRSQARSKYGGAASGGLSQAEVASILGMSERGVREVERRALMKLRNHPALREFWREFSGMFSEGVDGLTSEEIRALFDLAESPEDLALTERLVALISDRVISQAAQITN